MKSSKWINNSITYKLQWDYYNRGYLDKVDQSDYKEITIHSEKVKLSIIITMEWNQQHGWKPANYNLQTSPFEPTEESLCFLRGPLEWMMEPTNLNVSCIFDLRSHVIAKLSTAMVVKKLLVDDKYKLKQICLLGVVCNVSNRKTLSGKTFCFLKKHVLLIFKFCPLSIKLNVFLFFFTSCLLVLNQLSRNVLLF